MALRFATFLVLALLSLAAVGASGPGAAQKPTAKLSPSCAVPQTPGELHQPPQVDVGRLPLDDLGRHELIMRVVRDGPRFCFRYTFNGAPQVVAPTLRTHQGEQFAIRLVNEISGPAPGATMKASEIAPCMPASMPDIKVTMFSGYLNHTIFARTMAMQPLDVNLHLHGFEGPAAQENVFLSTLSTPAHACEYDVTIPRTQPPGTYFYHPHAHGMSGAEVGGGLAGMWIVQPDVRADTNVDERDIVLQTQQPATAYDPAQKARETAEISALMPVAAAHERGLRIVPPLHIYDPFDPPPWPAFIPLHVGAQRLDPDGCGFIAEVVSMVNGVSAPAHFDARPEKPQLLRILNALPNAVKYIRLRDAAGTPQTLHVVARDGIPVSNDDAHPLAHYVPMSGVYLGPGMRADILLTLHPGQTLTLYSDRFCNSPFGMAVLKHDILSASAPPSALPEPVHDAVSSTPLTAADSRVTQLLRYVHAHPQLVRRRALTYTQYEFPNIGGKGGHAEFYITDTSNRDFNEHPYWPTFSAGSTTPEHADIVVKRGSIEEWTLFNATPERHTFHIHQMAFTAEDEAPVPVMLDNIVVPPGRMLPNPGDPDFALVKASRTRILLDFRSVPRGEFVYHCHMLAHEDSGMMGIIRVM